MKHIFGGDWREVIKLIADTRVYDLAEWIKNDCLQLHKDYKNGHMSREIYNGSITDSQVTLDKMEEIWDVNLDEYSKVIEELNED